MPKKNHLNKSLDMHDAIKAAYNVMVDLYVHLLLDYMFCLLHIARVLYQFYVFLFFFFCYRNTINITYLNVSKSTYIYSWGYNHII